MDHQIEIVGQKILHKLLLQLLLLYFRFLALIHICGLSITVVRLYIYYTASNDYARRHDDYAEQLWPTDWRVKWKSAESGFV